MTKPTGRARELGATLRKYREAAGISELKLSKLLCLSHGQICRIEQGIRTISENNVARCLTLFGVFGPEHDEIMSLAKEVSDEYRLQAHGDKFPDELRTLRHYESTATTIDWYEPLLIPGMLQTEDYAWSIFNWTGLIPEEGIKPRVQARLERQNLMREPERPSYRFFVHEDSLNPAMIDDEIMKEQYLTLMFACDWRDCEVRLVPAKALPNGVWGGPFMFLRFKEYMPVTYVENVSTSMFLEDPTDIRLYRGIVNQLASLALPAGESREVFASRAM